MRSYSAVALLIGLAVVAAVAFGAYHVGRDSTDNGNAPGAPIYAVSTVVSATSTEGASESHPTSLRLSMDSARVLTLLNWQSWGGSRAIGTGIYGVDNCQPDCASGSYTWTAARVTLSHVGVCEGARAYLDVSVNGSKPEPFDLTGRCTN